MSPPAKVYETKHIYEVNMSILDMEDGDDFDEYRPLDGCVIKADEDDVQFLESLQPPGNDDHDDELC